MGCLAGAFGSWELALLLLKALMPRLESWLALLAPIPGRAGVDVGVGPYTLCKGCGIVELVDGLPAEASESADIRAGGPVTESEKSL